GCGGRLRGGGAVRGCGRARGRVPCRRCEDPLAAVPVGGWAMPALPPLGSRPPSDVDAVVPFFPAPFHRRMRDRGRRRVGRLARRFAPCFFGRLWGRGVSDVGVGEGGVPAVGGALRGGGGGPTAGVCFPASRPGHRGGAVFFFR